MPEPFDAFRYISYLASRWRWIAVSCAVALVLAYVLTSLQKPLYTATARIVIDPPAGTDIRAATAVSPIYLESLKTYEAFASGDSLFSSAVSRFGLRAELGGGAIESLKKRVLKVGLVRNTRILEIAATLPDPHKAQELAQFIAESTTATSRSLASDNDHDLIQGAEAEQRAARQRLDRSEGVWAKTLANEPTTDLEAALSADADLRAKLQEQLLAAEVDIAGFAEREKQASASDLPQIRSEQSDARVRSGEIRKQIEMLDRQRAAREKVLAARQADRERVSVEHKANQNSLVAIEARLAQARSDAGFRGERLRMIDPGVVPERPSSPNRNLNLMIALFLGVVLPSLYLAIELNYREQAIRVERNYPAVARSRDV